MLLQAAGQVSAQAEQHSHPDQHTGADHADLSLPLKWASVPNALQWDILIGAAYNTKEVGLAPLREAFLAQGAMRSGLLLCLES